jgi:hypothetical protein
LEKLITSIIKYYVSEKWITSASPLSLLFSSGVLASDKNEATNLIRPSADTI